MKLTRLLMGRAAWISLAGLGLALALAALQAQRDIRREGRGAGEVARLVGELAALATVDERALPAQLDKLDAIRRAGSLRHLTFQLEDGAGQILIAAGGADPVSRGQGAAATRLQLRRPDGRHFAATLIPDPASEQEEIRSGLSAQAGVFLAYALAMLGGLYWALRRALRPLGAILEAISTCRRQDFGVRLPPLPVEEFDHIGAALNHLAAALGAAEARQQHLSLQLLTLQEDERARLAQILHEEFGQDLAALRANLACLVRQGAERPASPALLRDLASQGTTLQQGLGRLQRQLQPVPGARDAQAGLNLQPLFDELLKSWQDVAGPATAYQLEGPPADLRVPRELGLTLYRMTQEALANIARHADARQVRLALQVAADDPSVLCWTLSDDGVGIAAVEAALCHGNGLAGLRERVWAHGGQFAIGPLGGGARPGLRLAARLPLGGAGRG